MEYVLSRYQIKAGKLREFKAALAKHVADKEGVEDSLRAAGVDLESLFIARVDEKDYLFVYKKLKDQDQIKEILDSPKSVADQSAASMINEFLDFEENTHSSATFDLSSTTE